MPANGKHPRMSGSVVERLHSFMQAHDLGLEELADFLETCPHTLAQWFKGTAMAPACSLIPLSLRKGFTRACRKRAFTGATVKKKCSGEFRRFKDDFSGA